MPVCESCKGDDAINVSGKPCPMCGQTIKGLGRTEYRGRKSRNAREPLVDWVEEMDEADMRDEEVEPRKPVILPPPQPGEPRVPPPIAERNNELLLPHQVPTPIDGLRAKKRNR